MLSKLKIRNAEKRSSLNNGTRGLLRRSTSNPALQEKNKSITTIRNMETKEETRATATITMSLFPRTINRLLRAWE